MYLNCKPKNFHFLVFVFLSSLLYGNCSEKDVTVSVEPRQQECFYEPLKAGQSVDIDYQVLDGGQGELDISFTFSAPDGRIIVMDYKKPENSHRYAVTEGGDYKICFDNTFSSFNSKTVFFEIIIDSDDDDEKEPWENIEQTPEEQYELTIQDIEDAVNRVKTHLTKIRHLQEAVRAFEARDRNIAEGNYMRVNSWSLIQISVMIVVGIIQVIMVKSLFDEQSRAHKLWKKGVSFNR